MGVVFLRPLFEGRGCKGGWFEKDLLTKWLVIKTLLSLLSLFSGWVLGTALWFFFHSFLIKRERKSGVGIKKVCIFAVRF